MGQPACRQHLEQYHQQKLQAHPSQKSCFGYLGAFSTLCFIHHWQMGMSNFFMQPNAVACAVVLASGAD